MSTKKVSSAKKILGPKKTVNRYHFSTSMVAPNAQPSSILVIDVGGTHIKILGTDCDAPRKFDSGPKMSPDQMVAGVLELAKGWDYNAVSIGYPGPVFHGKPIGEPHNLGTGWVGFDFAIALKAPVRLVNDAAMQAIGCYRGGKMLFLGLGTGLGSCMIADGYVESMELGHMPYKKHNYEYYVGKDGRSRLGRKQWQKHVENVLSILRDGLEPEYIVVGGGNSKDLDDLPKDCSVGENADAFTGGYRLWQNPPKVT